jgi:hypothetical protein
LYPGYFCPRCLCVMFLPFPLLWTNWSSPSLSSITLQNSQSILDPFSEVFKFLHHMEPCSKCNISLVSTLLTPWSRVLLEKLTSFRS